MENKFTPGPWTFEQRDDHNTDELKWVVDSEDNSICTLDGPEDFNEANAKLIAAAPEMLEALIQARKKVKGFDSDVYHLCNNIIKKATE